MLSTPQLCVSTYDVQMTTQISLTVTPVVYNAAILQRYIWIYTYMGDIGIILISLTGDLPLCWIYIFKCKQSCFCLTSNVRLIKYFDKFVWKLILWCRDASKSRTTPLFVHQFVQVKKEKLRTSVILAFCEEKPRLVKRTQNIHHDICQKPLLTNLCYMEIITNKRNIFNNYLQYKLTRYAGRTNSHNPVANDI